MKIHVGLPDAVFHPYPGVRIHQNPGCLPCTRPHNSLDNVGDIFVTIWWWDFGDIIADISVTLWWHCGDILVTLWWHFLWHFFWHCADILVTFLWHFMTSWWHLWHFGHTLVSFLTSLDDWHDLEGDTEGELCGGGPFLGPLPSAAAAPVCLQVHEVLLLQVVVRGGGHGRFAPLPWEVIKTIT